MRFKIVHFIMKMQNLGLGNSKRVTYAQPIAASLSTLFANWKQMEAQGTKGEVPAHSLLTDIIKNSEKTGNKNKSNRIEFQITIIRKQCRFCNYWLMES